jgi:hypothetical protein
VKLPSIDRDRALVAVAVVACLAFTLYVEHWLAAEVLKVPGVLAVAFPVALDAYVLAAMRTHQDRLWAFGLSAIAQGVAGLAATADKITDAQVGIMRGGFGIAVTMVLWRVHVILHALNASRVEAVVIEETAPATDPVRTSRVEAVVIEETAPATDPVRTVEQTADQTGPDHLELMDRTTGPDQPAITGPDQADQPDRTTTEAPDRVTGPDQPASGLQLVRTGPVPAGRVKELLPVARKVVAAFEREHGRLPGQKKLAELLRAKNHSCSIDVAVALLTEIRAETEKEPGHARVRAGQ